MERLIEVYLLNTENISQKADAILPVIAPYYANKYSRAKAPGVKSQELGAGYLLLKYLGVKSDDQLVFGEKGKPSLNKEMSDCYKEFSLSHCGKYVALAVSDSPVGVDIEKMKRITLPILKRVLPPYYYSRIEDEVRCLDDKEYQQKKNLMDSEESNIFSLEEDQNGYLKDKKFLLGKSWTCLEAVLKAAGTGFSTDDYNNDAFFDGWHTDSILIEDEYVLSCASEDEFELVIRNVEL